MLGVLDKCRKYGFGVDLGARIRPAMALDGRFTGSSFVRKLLQTKGHAARRPSPLQRGYLLGKFFEGISRLSHWDRIFGVADEDRFRCLRHWSITIASPLPEWSGGGQATHRPTRASDGKACIAEHAFAYTLLDCMIVDEEHVRHDTTLPLRAHDRRAHAVRPMFVSLTPTAGAGRGSAHELRARPATSVHFPGRIPVRAAPRVRKRDDGFLLPG
jgi:hypothetical protein